MSSLISKSCASAKPFLLMPGNFSSSPSDDTFPESKCTSFKNKKLGSFRFRSKCLQIRAVETSSVDIDHQWGAQRRTLAKAPASLKIAIIGFGYYGQFLAKTLVGQGHTVLAHSSTDYSDKYAAEHDKYAAVSQFITHTTGRILEKFGVESSSINTKGYETLLKLVENTGKDSFDLYYGLFMYNDNAMEQLEKLESAFQSLKRELSGNLQTMCTSQLFEDTRV